MGVVNRNLSRLFYKLGEKIGKYPSHFILGSLVVSLSLGTGILRLEYENNVERLFTQTDGPYGLEREQLDKYFNSSTKGSFDVSRSIRIGRFAR